jgi:hypothetical protein
MLSILCHFHSLLWSRARLHFAALLFHLSEC